VCIIMLEKYHILKNTLLNYTNRWVFGYTLHLTLTTEGPLIVPLTANITTANVQDNRTYVPLTSTSSSVFSLPAVRYMTTVYNRHTLDQHEYGKKVLGMDLVYPVE
jgi:hypothetical protein